MNLNDSNSYVIYIIIINEFVNTLQHKLIGFLAHNLQSHLFRVCIQTLRAKHIISTARIIFSAPFSDPCWKWNCLSKRFYFILVKRACYRMKIELFLLSPL